MYLGKPAIDKGQNQIDDKGVRILTGAAWTIRELFIIQEKIDIGAKGWLASAAFPLRVLNTGKNKIKQGSIIKNVLPLGFCYWLSQDIQLTSSKS